MTTEPRDLTYPQLLALLGGDVDQRLLLTAGEYFRVETPSSIPVARTRLCFILLPRRKRAGRLSRRFVSVMAAA